MRRLLAGGDINEVIRIPVRKEGQIFRSSTDRIPGVATAPRRLALHLCGTAPPLLVVQVVRAGDRPRGQSVEAGARHRGEESGKGARAKTCLCLYLSA